MVIWGSITPTPWLYGGASPLRRGYRGEHHPYAVGMWVITIAIRKTITPVTPGDHPSYPMEPSPQFTITDTPWFCEEEITPGPPWF